MSSLLCHRNIDSKDVIYISMVEKYIQANTPGSSDFLSEFVHIQKLCHVDENFEESL